MKIETIMLFMVVIFFVIYFIVTMKLERHTSEVQEKIIKHDKEMEKRIAAIEEKLKVIAKNSGIEFQNNYDKDSCWWAELPILEKRVNDLEAFLQSHSCQAKDKEDIQ